MPLRRIVSLKLFAWPREEPPPPPARKRNRYTTTYKQGQSAFRFKGTAANIPATPADDIQHFPDARGRPSERSPPSKRDVSPVVSPRGTTRFRIKPGAYDNLFPSSPEAAEDNVSVEKGGNAVPPALLERLVDVGPAPAARAAVRPVGARGGLGVEAAVAAVGGAVGGGVREAEVGHALHALVGGVGVHAVDELLEGAALLADGGGDAAGRVGEARAAVVTPERGRLVGEEEALHRIRAQPSVGAVVLVRAARVPGVVVEARAELELLVDLRLRAGAGELEVHARRPREEGVAHVRRALHAAAPGGRGRRRDGQRRRRRSGWGHRDGDVGHAVVRLVGERGHLARAVGGAVGVVRAESAEVLGVGVVVEVEAAARSAIFAHAVPRAVAGVVRLDRGGGLADAAKDAGRRKRAERRKEGPLPRAARTSAASRAVSG